MTKALANLVLKVLYFPAKANNLRLNDYIEYVLTELVNHQDDTNRDFIKNLLPWSDIVQKKFHSAQNHNSYFKVQIYRNPPEMAVSFLCGTHD